MQTLWIGPINLTSVLLGAKLFLQRILLRPKSPRTTLRIKLAFETWLLFKESECQQEKHRTHIGQSIHHAGDKLELSKTTTDLKSLINSDVFAFKALIKE